MAKDKNTYQDFIGDEQLEELEDKLAEARIRTEKHKAVDRQSKANLDLFEQITTDSAIKLAEKQSHLADLSQKLNEEKAELNRQTDLMHQQEMLNKSKAYTLQAAQKELEECQLRYCQTIETVNNINNKIREYEAEIEKASIQVKSAYNNWQHNYNNLQEQRLAADKNARTIAQLQSKIQNLNHQQELSRNRAADQLADTVILNLDKDLDITDLHITDLPRATMGTQAVIPEIPPIDNELAALIKEATSAAPNSEYKSLRPENVGDENEEPEAIDNQTVLAVDNAEPDQTEDEGADDFWSNPKERQANIKQNAFLADTKSKEQEKSPEEALAESVNATVEKVLQSLPPEAGGDDNPPPNQSAAAESEPKPVVKSNDDKPIEDNPKAKKGKKHPLIAFLVCIVIAIAIALLLRLFVFQITEISGDSMNPTLTSGERAISSTISYYFDDVEREDIIVFHAPDRTDGAYYVKRVIGLPGDHVVIADGKVTVNSKILEEEYLNGAATEGSIDTMVPNDEYFVLGDNRAVSHDSRSPEVSTIEKDEILGKLVFILYPFSEIGPIE